MLGTIHQNECWEQENGHANARRRGSCPVQGRHAAAPTGNGSWQGGLQQQVMQAGRMQRAASAATATLAGYSARPALRRSSNSGMLQIGNNHQQQWPRYDYHAQDAMGRPEGSEGHMDAGWHMGSDAGSNQHYSLRGGIPEDGGMFQGVDGGTSDGDTRHTRSSSFRQLRHLDAQSFEGSYNYGGQLRSSPTRGRSESQQCYDRYHPGIHASVQQPLAHRQTRQSMSVDEWQQHMWEQLWHPHQ
jgi:hypothetical protein